MTGRVKGASAKPGGREGAATATVKGALILRRVLQLAALRGRSNDFKELEIVVLRHELAILHQPSDDDDDRPAILGGGKPAPAAGALAMLHDRADDATALASVLGGEALDVRVTCWSAGDPPGGPGVGPASGEREPAVGISAHRG